MGPVSLTPAGGSPVNSGRSAPGGVVAGGQAQARGGGSDLGQWGRKRLTGAALSMAVSVNRRSSSVMGSPEAVVAGGWIVEQVGARVKHEVVAS
jgi:hypothetical protein